MRTILELRDVSHAYVGSQGAALAVQAIDLKVETGEFISLVGPSGCGKTTILSMLAGLIMPSRGEVLLHQKPVAGPADEIGYMLQQDYLFPWRTIRDNATIGLEIKGLKSKAAEKRVDQLLLELGLGDAGSRYPHELSGGMRQRAALARTLAAEPEVLLLDEPFSALDTHIKLQLEDLVWSMLRKMGKTIVLVTHDLAEAAAMSDRVIVLGAHPGVIRKELCIPEPVRACTPGEARKRSEFERVFEELLGLIEDPELERGGEAQMSQAAQGAHATAGSSDTEGGGSHG